VGAAASAADAAAGAALATGAAALPGALALVDAGVPVGSDLLHPETKPITNQIPKFLIVRQH
jgi:hypothetical protein